MALVSNLIELLLVKAPLELKGYVTSYSRNVDSRGLCELALDGDVLMATRTLYLQMVMG